MTDSTNNVVIAQRLFEVAQLLEHQGANPFRVSAYMNASETLRRLPQSVSEIIAADGIEGLKALPGIGDTLANAIHILVRTGRLPILDRLRGEADPTDLLATIPGIGPKLARKLHDDLGIDSLEDLELAAHDGRLGRLPGFGPKKVEGVIDALIVRLGKFRLPRYTANEPSVAELLDVDREYREKAVSGRLRTIAPRRFNPEGRSWLPVLHAHRETRHYTALYSNTSRAHHLGKTRDWVVLYCDGEHGERQYTVVTGSRAPFVGARVIRGREAECAEHYRRVKERLETKSDAETSPAPA